MNSTIEELHRYFKFSFDLEWDSNGLGEKWIEFGEYSERIPPYGYNFLIGMEGVLELYGDGVVLWL